MADQESEVKTTFICDNGCSGHMTHYRLNLRDIRKINPISINVAKKWVCMTANEFGTAEGDNIILKHATHVTEMSKTLLSVNAVTNNGGAVVFNQTLIKNYYQMIKVIITKIVSS